MWNKNPFLNTVGTILTNFSALAWGSQGVKAMFGPLPWICVVLAPQLKNALGLCPVGLATSVVLLTAAVLFFQR